MTIIDPKVRWTVDPSQFRSKSANTPFAGWELTGRAEVVIVGGRVKFRRGDEEGLGIRDWNQEHSGMTLRSDAGPVSNPQSLILNPSSLIPDPRPLMSLLIDGYNLLYVAGILGRGIGPGACSAAGWRC